MMTKVICIIPARNEAGRVGKVVEVALKASCITGGVYVVDNGSTDATALEAYLAGAQVLSFLHPGKGGAVAYAVNKLAGSNDVILLLDADVTGLSMDHIETLLAPIISGSCIQSGGVLDGNWWRLPLSSYHIGLTGIRAFRASLLWEIYPLDYQGWSLEVALNSICRWSPKRRKRQIAKVFLGGVYDLDKSQKYPSRQLAVKAKREVFRECLKGTLRFSLSVRLKHLLE